MRQIKPQLVVLSAPSGAGKTTICKMLEQKNQDFKISVSATTRPARFNEKDGVHYYFLTREEFFNRVKQGDFLEYEEVHGNYYGTLKSRVKALLNDGYTVLFDIDVNGALNIKKHFPHAILVFIRPPSMEELRRRLHGRKTDDEKEIEKRLERLPQEYSKAVFFDYDIVNSHVEDTVAHIEEIIREHQRRDSYVSDIPAQG